MEVRHAATDRRITRQRLATDAATTGTTFDSTDRPTETSATVSTRVVAGHVPPPFSRRLDADSIRPRHVLGPMLALLLLRMHRSRPLQGLPLLQLWLLSEIRVRRGSQYDPRPRIVR